MKKVVFLGLMLGLALTSQAQIANLNMNGVPARVTPYSGIEGSPYLFDEWSVADITLRGGEVKEKVSMKVNTFENELEIMNEQGTRIILEKKQVRKVKLERPAGKFSPEKGDVRVLTFQNGYEGLRGVGQEDFVNVLAEGNYYTVVRTYRTTLQEPVKNSYAPTPGKMFVFGENLYLLGVNKEAQSVRAKTSSIVKALEPEDRALAKSIIKNRSLNLSREDHLITFFEELHANK
ncbi:hypothetical protein A3SI_12694 [Nitritalea halalkaliphila LW7]|uniref:Uncharacterized protein n=2 Tax=Nitritalea TaxID=1187887 RepID=I5C1K2_9BACT|nr:hypothetical protein A3SI_12694 [Nitritalea halalkaliphila LW7]